MDVQLQNDNKTNYDYLQMSNMKEVKNTMFGYKFHPSRINEAVEMIKTETKTKTCEPPRPPGANVHPSRKSRGRQQGTNSEMGHKNNPGQACS